MNEKKIKTIDLIQNIISRMAANSFMLKGWAVSLVVAFFAFATGNTKKELFLVAYVPIVAFWGLDAYYLRKERQYRQLYEWTCRQPEDRIDFDLNCSRPGLQNASTSFWSAALSATELWFYLPLAAFITFIIIILQGGC